MVVSPSQRGSRVSGASPVVGAVSSDFSDSSLFGVSDFYIAELSVRTGGHRRVDQAVKTLKPRGSTGCLQRRCPRKYFHATLNPVSADLPGARS